METTPENIVKVLKQQIENTQRDLDLAGYNPASVREQVAMLAKEYGSPALDVGTGAFTGLAEILAENGLVVTAIDQAHAAVSIAHKRIAEKHTTHLDVHNADAAHLPFPDCSFRVVTAFDSLCHTGNPIPVVAEMFRVCDRHGGVIITELNDAGRIITHHLDQGFQNKLPALLAPHCRDCQQLSSAHHVIFICERN